MATEADQGEGNEGFGGGKAVGHRGDQPNFGVAGLDEPVGQVVFSGVQDPFAVFDDALLQFDERRNSATSGPADPPVQGVDTTLTMQPSRPLSSHSSKSADMPGRFKVKVASSTSSLPGGCVGLPSWEDLDPHPGNDAPTIPPTPTRGPTPSIGKSRLMGGTVLIAGVGRPGSTSRPSAE